jgi:UDP-2,4-diacetamido-2,4,6-trideoxy-beta-L-altropyranose hydrolase
MAAQRLLIRADAGRAIGYGHVIRCLALAQEWRLGGGQVLFASALLPPAIAALVRAEGMEAAALDVEPGSAADAAATDALRRRWQADWIAVDGYRFRESFLRPLRAGGTPLLLLDDAGGIEPALADAILNQNLHAIEGLYPTAAEGPALLLGTRFALLRLDIRRQRPRPEPAPAGRRLLITMGGGDEANATAGVLEALRPHAASPWDATVLVGGANPNGPAIEAAARVFGGRVDVRVGDFQVGRWLAWADTAVANAGSTAWELAYMGLPSLLLATSPNQRPVAESLAAAGAALALTPQPSVMEDLAEPLRVLLGGAARRAALARRARGLVDGFGAHRAVAALTGAPVALRAAGAADCRLVWKWANDPEVRRASFAMDAIDWDAHEVWFAAAVRAADVRFFIADDVHGAPVGQVRFSLAGGEATISTSLAPDRRGRGLGAAVIRSASAQLFALTDVARIHALIKRDNERSRAAFERAGYGDARAVIHQGQAAWKLVCTRVTGEAR